MKLENKMILVTPHQAKYWLDNCNLRNRNLRETQVRQFVKDMLNDNWEMTHQGIAFYEDGMLADGQHRLAAIVKANVSVKLFVATGLPQKTAKTIDQNRPRMMHDVIRIGGENDWIDKHVVAICRFLLGNMGESTETPSVNTVVDLANKYKHSIQLVKSMTGTKKRYVTHSGLAASYVCALIAGVPDEKIKRFTEVMLSGEIFNATENAAIRLREFLISNPGCWIGRSRLETSMKAQRAIDAFAKNQPLAKLYTPASLTYPIPE